MRGAVLLPLAALSLAACSDPAAEKQQALASQTQGNGTVAASLSELADMRTLASAMTDSQLAPVLDGNGDYTVLAPSDAAFAALGDEGKALLARDRQPLLIAVLRGHILPGQVTPEAIAKAIDRKQGPVQMATMAGRTVTFAKAGKDITVTNGAVTATLSAAATVTMNGAILPIDKVLLPKN